MLQEVGEKLILRGKCFPAFATTKAAPFFVGKEVLVQVALLTILVSAPEDRTDEGLFLAMDPEVIEQIVPLLELFSTDSTFFVVASE